jgi:hypothetical protein
VTCWLNRRLSRGRFKTSHASEMKARGPMSIPSDQTVHDRLPRLAKTEFALVGHASEEDPGTDLEFPD